mmetsp:Transcript_146055/g.466780  ORF Transcript_146055/g.466780 Transcript_146055/m.466780 type:complete len:130 (-) Transcript_146055:132-521(-)
MMRDEEADQGSDTLHCMGCLNLDEHIVVDALTHDQPCLALFPQVLEQGSAVFRLWAQRLKQMLCVSVDAGTLVFREDGFEEANTSCLSFGVSGGHTVFNISYYFGVYFSEEYSWIYANKFQWVNHVVSA